MTIDDGLFSMVKQRCYHCNEIFMSRKYSINCLGKLLDLTAPVVMGILNITPDSFFDGGKFSNENNMLQQVEKMLNEGAAIIDVGAVSTRPKAENISEEEELKRLIPVLKTILQHFPNTVLSVDTYRSHVAEVASENGAAIINDISAGEFDENMLATIARLNLPYIMMHIQGTPQTMQQNPTYENVTLDIIRFFVKKLELLRNLGVKDIIIDPGFGFGKTLEHNYQLLSSLHSFAILDCPVMVGVSRKSMINKVLQTKPENALNGTTVTNTIALMNGANILRVHDVKEAVEVVKIVKEYQMQN